MRDLSTLYIDEDITGARTIPAWVYSDPEIFELARERVFLPAWHWVTDSDRIKVPGQVLPFTLLDGILEEPLLLTRDRDDRTHCLSNVCTHRGTLVCESERVEQQLRCRYHGRRFHLDGRFQSMPEFENTRNFPSADDDLPRVPMASWKNQIFASLQPSAPFEVIIKPIRDRCDWLPLEDARFDANRSRDYLVEANWALYIDNYLEGFHIPFVHAGLADAVDYGSYTTECFSQCSLQLAEASEGEVAFDAPVGHPDYQKGIAAYYWWIFPNTMLNLYPWGLSLNVVKPLAVDRTRVSFLSYVMDETKLDQGAGGILDRVEREDEVIVESIQRGSRARLYESGRYSPTREQGVHHFHRLLTDALRR